MARPRNTPEPSVGGTVDEALAETGQGEPPATDGQETPRESRRKPPALPTKKTGGDLGLDQRTVLLYGPPGIGKSTLASEWSGGNTFFFDTAGELRHLQVYRQAIDSWSAFREYAWAITEKPDQFGAIAIDTIDQLAKLCAYDLRRKLKIQHEGDLDYGQGYDRLTEEFYTKLAQLALLPGGLVMVSHAREEDVKTRTMQYRTNRPSLGPRGCRDAVVKMADLILFVDWANDEEGGRVIRTKPDKEWEAKERSEIPHLPAEVPWPIGASGYQVLKDAWKERT